MSADLEEAIETLQAWARDKRWGMVKFRFTGGTVALVVEETTRVPASKGDP